MTGLAVQKLSALGRTALALSMPLHESETTTSQTKKKKEAQGVLKSFFQSVSRTPARIGSLISVGLSVVLGLRKLFKGEYTTGSFLDYFKSFWVEGLLLVLGGFGEILNAQGRKIQKEQLNIRKFYENIASEFIDKIKSKLNSSINWRFQGFQGLDQINQSELLQATVTQLHLPRLNDFLEHLGVKLNKFNDKFYIEITPLKVTQSNNKEYCLKIEYLQDKETLANFLNEEREFLILSRPAHSTQPLNIEFQFSSSINHLTSNMYSSQILYFLQTKPLTAKTVESDLSLEETGNETSNKKGFKLVKPEDMHEATTA